MATIVLCVPLCVRMSVQWEWWEGDGQINVLNYSYPCKTESAMVDGSQLGAHMILLGIHNDS